MTTPDITPDPQNQQPPVHHGAWQSLLNCTWRTPLGLMGISVTTISITLLVISLFAHMAGLIDNHYASIFTFLVLPIGMLFGLVSIPLSCFLHRRGWFGATLSADHLTINLSDPKHRKTIILFLVLTVINVTLLAVVSYEGYHFTDSPYFCGVVCHKVMDPEYTAYQRSPHAKVSCVECHIGSGADWYVRAKISGLRQVQAVFQGNYSRPVPAPVEHLRPARDTCEQCHWPEKFHGKKVKTFISFSNKDQLEPSVQEIALHIGGRNPVTDTFEGIHWHVSNNIKVQYQPMNDKRTQIGRIKVTKDKGVTEEYTVAGAEESTHEWRTMDCIDCHNRPTHVYDDLEERIDFGLLSKRIDPNLAGIREDSITVLKKEYTSRDEASEQIVETLLDLQAERHGAEFVAKNEQSLITSGSFLLETYLNNIWPAMNVTWNTYPAHMGHRYADEGFGCFRCHDEEHSTNFGKVISQDCALCHDEPN